jgi:hypothetical protein
MLVPGPGREGCAMVIGLGIILVALIIYAIVRD